MALRDEWFIAASKKYDYCEEAQAAFRVAGKCYNGTYATRSEYQVVLFNTGASAIDDITLNRVLNEEAAALFAKTHKLWLRVADINLENARELLAKYQEWIDGKKPKLITVVTAPAKDSYDDRLKRAADTLGIQKSSPPKLTNALDDDWGPQLLGVRQANEEITKIHCEMAEWIGKAEKESREKASDRRGKFMLGWGVLGGGGVVGILSNLDKIAALFGR